MIQAQTFKVYPYEPKSVTWPVVAAIFMLVACVVGMWMSANEIMVRNQLNSIGITTQATVIDRDITSSTNAKGNRSTNYYLTYTYEATDINGITRNYRVRQGVNSNVYNQSARSVTVVYLPSDPNTVRVKSISTDGVTTIFSGVMIVVWLAFAGGCAWFLLKVYQSSQLREYGKHLQGQIVSATGTTFKSKGQTKYNVTIAYEFVSPTTGAHIQGQATTERTDMLNQPLPERGTPIEVLYLNDKIYALE